MNYVRTEKNKMMFNMHNTPFVKIPSLDSFTIKKATVFPIKKNRNDFLLFGRGGVVDDKGYYIKESGIPGRIEGSYSYDSKYADLTVVYLGYAVPHWGHFLIEAVTRLWYFLKHDSKEIDKYIFVTELEGRDSLSGNYQRFLELLGISEKIMIINRPYTFKKVIVPQSSFEYTTYYSDEYLEIFQRVIENALKVNCEIDNCEKVYFSRNRFSKAKKTEFGNELVDDFFLTNDYKILYPEELSLEAMIHYIQKADICAMTSGTLPHNMLFAQQGKKVIVIERQSIINHVQIQLDIIKELNITYVDANYSIYPVTAGGGPFIYAANQYLLKYAKENSMVIPNEKYRSDNFIRKNLT